MMSLEAWESAVAEHCDLEWRLAQVPASARIRGFYYRAIRTALEPAGKWDEYASLLPERRAPVASYPVADFLRRVCVAGAILESPENVHEGMRRIAHGNAVAASESLLGRVMIRLLSGDPKRLLHQGISVRRQSCLYGRWSLEFPSDSQAIMTMTDEYIWPDSYMLGAAQGTMATLPYPVSIRAELITPFSCRTYFSW